MANKNKLVESKSEGKRLNNISIISGPILKVKSEAVWKLIDLGFIILTSEKLIFLPVLKLATTLFISEF